MSQWFPLLNLILIKKNSQSLIIGRDHIKNFLSMLVQIGWNINSFKRGIRYDKVFFEVYN
jgi:hypothetical protein